MKDANNDKDAESKRPPWRTVSVSTLPKPDKSALLRAKLLDASRRLRAGKCSVAIQTDMEPVKLMKDVSITTQTDLILYKEIGILTDGSYIKKKTGSEEFVLTYSVSQLTDAIPVKNCATQTLLPKISGDDFMEAYFHNDLTTINIDKFSNIERKLLNQISDINEIRNNLPPHLVNNKLEFKSNSIQDSSNNMINSKTEATSEPMFNRSNNKSQRRSSFLKPTFSSWHFKYGELENITKSFVPYTITPNSSIASGSINSLPFDLNGYSLEREYSNWILFLNAVDSLVADSNRLINMIKRAESKEMKNLENISHGRHEFPSEYWLPIIEQQEKELDEVLKESTQKTSKNENDDYVI